jgi:hypothetical protein
MQRLKRSAQAYVYPCPNIFEQQFQNLQAHTFVMEAAGRIDGLDEIFEQTGKTKATNNE